MYWPRDAQFEQSVKSLYDAFPSLAKIHDREGGVFNHLRLSVWSSRQYSRKTLQETLIELTLKSSVFLPVYEWELDRRELLRPASFAPMPNNLLRASTLSTPTAP